MPHTTHNNAPTDTRTWGRSKLTTVRICTLVAIPFVVVGVICFVLISLLMLSTIAHDLSAAGISEWSPLLFGAVSVFCTCLTILVISNWWLRVSPHTIWTDDEKVVCTSIVGKTTIFWTQVIQAVVIEDHTLGLEQRVQQLCLTTRWRTLLISPRQILSSSLSLHERQRYIDDFLGSVQSHLEAQGVHLDRNQPTTHLLYSPWIPQLIFWPHRRILARKFEQINSPQGRERINHYKKLPSLHLGWVFRAVPSPVAAVVLSTLTLATLAMDGGLGTALILCAALIGVPLFNACMQKFAGIANTLQPEMMVGRDTFQGDLAETLVPAPMCAINLKGRYVQRPDGKRWSFDEIEAVSFGPKPRRGDAQVMSVTPKTWQLAIRERGEKGETYVIYNNANIDMIWHGDLDGGYALFNWIAAREIAFRSEASMTLATGTTPYERLDQTLIERLDNDLTNYAPDPLRDAIDRSGFASRVWIDRDETSLHTWGPLVRQPARYAAPPLWKALMVVAGLVVVGSGGGALAPWVGYLIALTIHEMIMFWHFQTPGFTLDHKGVWVRGHCLPWHSLRETSLMPVSSGPIFFTAPRSLMVAGHLGSSYHERAWLGCSVYDWMAQQKCNLL